MILEMLLLGTMRKQRARPGRGRRFTFHGAFATKAKAQARERAGRGRFIRRVKVRGSVRYVVMERRR